MKYPHQLSWTTKSGTCTGLHHGQNFVDGRTFSNLDTILRDQVREEVRDTEAMGITAW